MLVCSSAIRRGYGSAHDSEAVFAMIGLYLETTKQWNPMQCRSSLSQGHYTNATRLMLVWDRTKPMVRAGPCITWPHISFQDNVFASGSTYSRTVSISDALLTCKPWVWGHYQNQGTIKIGTSNLRCLCAMQ